MSSRFRKNLALLLSPFVLCALACARHEQSAQNATATKAAAQSASVPTATPTPEQMPEALTAARPVLRVCADPNNLPFSNRRGEGFENKLAELLARDLSATVEYTWWAQRRGFFRSTLR